MWGQSRGVFLETTMGVLSYWLDNPKFSLVHSPLFPFFDVVQLVQTATTMRMVHPGITRAIRGNPVSALIGWLLLNSMCMILTNFILGETPITFVDTEFYAKIAVWLAVLNPPYDLVFAFTSNTGAKAFSAAVVTMKVVRKVGMGMLAAEAAFPDSVVAKVLLGAIGGASGSMTYTLESYFRTGQWPSRVIDWGSGFRHTFLCIALFFIRETPYVAGVITHTEIVMIGYVLVLASEYMKIFLEYDILQVAEYKMTYWTLVVINYSNPKTWYDKIKGYIGGNSSKKPQSASKPSSSRKKK